MIFNDSQLGLLGGLDGRPLQVEVDTKDDKEAQHLRGTLASFQAVLADEEKRWHTDLCAGSCATYRLDQLDPCCFSTDEHAPSDAKVGRLLLTFWLGQTRKLCSS